MSLLEALHQEGKLKFILPNKAFNPTRKNDDVVWDLDEIREMIKPDNKEFSNQDKATIERILEYLNTKVKADLIKLKYLKDEENLTIDLIPPLDLHINVGKYTTSMSKDVGGYQSVRNNNGLEESYIAVSCKILSEIAPTVVHEIEHVIDKEIENARVRLRDEEDGPKHRYNSQRFCYEKPQVLKGIFFLFDVLTGGYNDFYQHYYGEYNEMKGVDIFDQYQNALLSFCQKTNKELDFISIRNSVTTKGMSDLEKNQRFALVSSIYPLESITFAVQNANFKSGKLQKRIEEKTNKLAEELSKVDPADANKAATIYTRQNQYNEGFDALCSLLQDNAEKRALLSYDAKIITDTIGFVKECQKQFNDAIAQFEQKTGVSNERKRAGSSFKGISAAALSEANAMTKDGRC